MSRWGEEKTLLFVTYYKSYECLWNQRSPLYKNNEARNKAYESLLNDMNDPKLTIKYIKTKIKNLRTVYHSELKKIYASKLSGAGAEEVYRPTLSWFKEMASLMEDTGDYCVIVGSELESETSSQHSISANNDNSIIISPPIPPTRSSGEYSRRRKKVRNLDESLGVAEALNHSENILSPAITIQNNEDEFHYFGLNVAAQLRQLPLYEALGVQTEIHGMLAEARRRNM